MIPKYLTTQYPFHVNSQYPLLIVKWFRDEDELGADGQCYIVTDTRKLSDKPDHIISIRQCLPLNYIVFDLDQCKGGSWRTGKVDSVVLTELDLQWATAWAAMAIEHKRIVLDLPGGAI